MNSNDHEQVLQLLSTEVHILTKLQMLSDAEQPVIKRRQKKLESKALAAMELSIRLFGKDTPIAISQMLVYESLIRESQPEAS